MIAEIRRAPSKMGDILCSLSASANQVSFNLNSFFSVAYLLILFTIKIYHRLSIGLRRIRLCGLLITLASCRTISQMLYYSTFPSFKVVKISLVHIQVDYSFLFLAFCSVA